MNPIYLFFSFLLEIENIYYVLWCVLTREISGLIMKCKRLKWIYFSETYKDIVAKISNILHTLINWLFFFLERAPLFLGGGRGEGDGGHFREISSFPQTLYVCISYHWLQLTSLTPTDTMSEFTISVNLFYVTCIHKPVYIQLMMYTYINTYIHAYDNRCLYTYIHTYSYAKQQAYFRVLIHKYRHTGAYKHRLTRDNDTHKTDQCKAPPLISQLM